MILLDTPTLLYWVNGHPALSEAATSAIASAQASSCIYVSSISAWELAGLVEQGRLILTRPVHEWIAMVAKIEAVRFVPVDEQIAVNSVSLPGAFQGGLADQIIVATSRELVAPIVTQDPKIREYPHVKTIW